MKDLTLIIENVRSFRGRHEIPIRPLTVLTGENSSGKTTLLAMFSAVCDQESYPLRPDFNRTPYNLGNYETVASYKTLSEHGTPHFSLGFRKADADLRSVLEAHARYINKRGYIHLSTFRARGKGFEFSMDVKRGTIDQLNGLATIRVKERTSEEPFSNLQAGPGALQRVLLDAAEGDHNGEFSQELLELSLHLGHLAPVQVRSLAPIRTQPERVYSQATVAYKPTGDHIPFVLERLLEENGKSREGKSLSQLLSAFGVESGLFQGVTVNRFGGQPSAPFEIRVGLGSTTVNLADVGYGVSQVLPLLVEASTAPRDQYLLFQQPEIHLHPRAQAALGTLFAQLAAENHCRLAIETHNDYLIDRVRQEVAAGKIDPNKVALLYLHREGLETKCHLIELDSIGNLINPPDYYRSFFLEERWRLLHRDARH